MNLKQLILLNKLLLLVFLFSCCQGNTNTNAFTYEPKDIGGKFIFNLPNFENYTVNLDTVSDNTEQREVIYSLNNKKDSIEIIISIELNSKIDCKGLPNDILLSDQKLYLRRMEKNCISPLTYEKTYDNKIFNFIRCKHNSTIYTCTNNYLVLIHFFGLKESEDLNQLFSYEN